MKSITAFTVSVATAVTVLAAQPRPAQAADKISVAVVSLGSALQWPLWIAIDKGFAAHEGITVDPVATRSGTNVLQQLVAGAVDLGLPTTADTVRAISDGAPLKIIRNDLERAPHSIVAKPDIKSIASLKGKTIIISTMKGLDRIYFDMAISAGDLNPGQYSLIAAGSTSSRFAALMSGAVDAATVAAPFSFRAESAGYNDLGSVQPRNKKYPYTSYVAYASWLKAHHDTVDHFLAAYSAAVRWFNDPQHKTEACDILLKWGKATRKDA